MNPELNSIREQLEERKNVLMKRISNVKTDISKEYSADWSEQAQERQNDEVLEAIGIETRNELIQINQALQRIESGEYMHCSNCGKLILLERLKTIPYTDLCIQCADKGSPDLDE